MLTTWSGAAVWSAPSGGGTGYITAVYPGTGMTGGGTSGDVTLGLTVPLFLSGNVPPSEAMLDLDADGTFRLATRAHDPVRIEAPAGYTALTVLRSSGIGAFSNSGTGVYAFSAAANAILAEAWDLDYAGVHASHMGSGDFPYLANDEYGVLGYKCDESAVGGLGSDHGVYCRCYAGGTRYAGSFNGPVNVNGALTKSSGSFKIDHPLDPANRYLSHSFVESPDMMNVYNRNVVTDADGYATVTLPEWSRPSTTIFAISSLSSASSPRRSSTARSRTTAS